MTLTAPSCKSGDRAASHGDIALSFESIILDTNDGHRGDVEPAIAAVADCTPVQGSGFAQAYVRKDTVVSVRGCTPQFDSPDLYRI